MKIKTIAVVAMLASPVAAHATLGGAPGVGDLAAAPTVITQPQQPAFTIQDSLTTRGVSVREFITKSGKVFAVSWRGPVRPNMKTLLGPYFSQFANASASGTLGTGTLMRHFGDLTIQSSGRRDYYDGKAIVQSLVPAGVSMGDLK